jgi:hypothetical protein
MSDYLWDKKGDADAEVARLETLLGALKHEPRPLALPAEAAAPEPTPAGLLPFVSRLRASRHFAPAALAAAAALVVASVLVASVFLRAQRPAPRAAEKAMLNFPPDASGAKAKTTPAEVRVGGGKVEDDKVRVESLPRAQRPRKDVQAAAAPRRKQKGSAAEPLPGEGLTLETMSTPNGASSLVEGARLLTKEQLVYALRLTGAKLRDVRQKAQGTQNDER